MTDTIALVTGANRGLGLEVSNQLAERGMVVYLGNRSLDGGELAAAPLLSAGLDVRPVRLDVTDAGDRAAAVARVARDHGRVDVIVNNAAIHYDTGRRAVAPDFGVVREALETNLYGAWHTTLAFLPLLERSDHGRIVNVSSAAGALAEMGGGHPAYSVSKVGLNALTRMWAAELRPQGILVNSVCPGWTATDMGGRGGRPIPEGAAGIVWAATLPDDGPTGGFFRDGSPIPW